MPRRNDLSSVLVIGSGPIVIGQACEFDYSGTQACRVLKEEGLRVILVNSNPATIMTDPGIADATYVEPITPEVVASIIEKERPDALLPTLGGQTALNTAVALAGVIIYAKRYAIYRKGYRAQRILFKELKSINAISLPVSLQMGMETFAFTGSAFMAGWLGEIPLAAYQVIITISTLGFLFYYSFAAGMSIRIATFHGTGDWPQLRMAARAGRNILLGLVVVANFVFFFFTEPLVHFFTPDAKVTVAAMSLLVPLMVY